MSTLPASIAASASAIALATLLPDRRDRSISIDVDGPPDSAQLGDSSPDPAIDRD
jgi:hypothetical protein